MANSRYSQFYYTKHMMPMQIDLKVPIGGTGAVGTIAGGGVASVARNGVGIYQINFVDTYSSFYRMSWDFLSPNSGSGILVASAGTVSGTSYVITVVGTTTTAGWQSLGLPVGITPAVGVAFKATATTTATGTGAVQVQLATGSGILAVEPIGDPSLTINPIGIGRANAYMIVQCLAATDSSTTTLVAKDPASGSTMCLGFIFSNSSVTYGTNG